MAKRLRSDLNGYVDVGAPLRRWSIAHTIYMDTYSRWVMMLDGIGRRSAIFGIEDLPAANENDLYLVVIHGKWRAVRADTPPPDASQEDGGRLLQVLAGLWTIVNQPYHLPYPYPMDAWLCVIDGKWGSMMPNLTPLPVVADYDDGHILGVIGGIWDKTDGDNFYLPNAEAITPEVEHLVQCVGGKWLKRPFDQVNNQSMGLLPEIPGKEELAFHGDKTWRGIHGRDVGHWRLGDLRIKGCQQDSVWLDCDGSSVARYDADYTNVEYYDIYYFLGGTLEQWIAGEKVYLPTIPNHEILKHDRLANPVHFHVITGPVSNGPYELEIATSSSFDHVMFESKSDVDVLRWEDVDGIWMCNLAGMVDETWARFAEPVVAAAVMDVGFFYYRWRAQGKAWNIDKTWVTEEELFRLDTILSAGIYTSAVTVRAPVYRHSVISINGRALKGELYKINNTTHGSALQRNTDMYTTDMVNDPLGYKKDDEEALQGLEIVVYGGGDSEPYVMHGEPKLNSLLQQLKELDGHRSGRTPKYKLVKIPFGGNKKKWWGGCVGADMKLYFVPHYAETILMVDPKTGDFRRWGKFGNDKGKWSGAVAAFNDKIYCMPYAQSNFLVLSPLKRRGDVTPLGAFNLRAGTWLGGCLTLDNKITSVSLFGHQELEIDLDTETARQFDLHEAMRKIPNPTQPIYIDKYEHPYRWYTPHGNYLRTAGTTFISQASNQFRGPLASGCVMGSNGVVRAVPCGTWFLESRTRKKHWATSRADLGPVPDRELFYWGFSLRDWKVFSEPFHTNTATAGSSMMRYVDYDWRDRSNNGMPAGYSGVKSRRHYDYMMHKRMRYMGGILAPDGNNYFLPCSGDSPEVLVAAPAITPYDELEQPTSAFDVSDIRFASCRGGCLGPDGNIYAAAADGTAVFVITPRTRQVVTIEIEEHKKLHPRYSAWMGAVVGPDGYIYFPPFDSEYMLVVDPCVSANPWSAELNCYINKF